MTAAGLPTFLAASLVLAVTPGPGVLYIVGRTLAQGRRAGLASAAGVACGNYLNAVAAALGLAALLAVSDLAFNILRFAGCAWLVWLGAGMLLAGWRARRRSGACGGSAGSAPGAVHPPGPPVSLPQRPSTRRLFVDGLLVALFNPKTTLFFAAFLPQFVDAAAATVLPETLSLAAVFVGIAACTDACYALLASRWAGLRRTASVGGAAAGLGRMACGALLIGLGLIGGSADPRRAGR